MCRLSTQQFFAFNENCLQSLRRHHFWWAEREAVMSDCGEHLFSSVVVFNLWKVAVLIEIISKCDVQYLIIWMELRCTKKRKVWHPTFCPPAFAAIHVKTWPALMQYNALAKYNLCITWSCASSFNSSEVTNNIWQFPCVPGRLYYNSDTCSHRAISQKYMLSDLSDRRATL